MPVSHMARGAAKATWRGKFKNPGAAKPLVAANSKMLHLAEEQQDAAGSLCTPEVGCEPMLTARVLCGANQKGKVHLAEGQREGDPRIARHEPPRGLAGGWSAGQLERSLRRTEDAWHH